MPDDPLAWMNAKPAGAPAPAERADPLAWMGSTKPAAPLTPAPVDEGRPRPRPAPVPGEPAILPDAPEPAAADRFYDGAWLAAQAPQSRPAPAPPPSPNAGFEPVPGEDVADRIIRQQRGMQAPPVEGPAPAQGISPRAPRQGEAPGILGSIVQGGVRGLVSVPEGLVEGARVATGDRSARPSSEVNDPFTRRQAKPWSQVSWDEFAPWVAGKISEGLAASAPTVAAAIAGAGLGGVAAGPGGALAGGAAGGGLGAAVQTLGPAFQRAMADGKSPDDAYETALKESGVAAVFGLAGGAVGAGMRSTLKKAVFDIFAVQPALNVGQTATQNVVAGRPNTADELIESGITGLGTGLAFEAPGAARAAFTRAPSVGPEVAGAASGIQAETRAAQGADAPFNAEEPAGPQAGGIALGLPAPPRREALAGPPNLPRLTDETGTVAGEGFTARPTTPAERGAAEAREMARAASEAAGRSTRTQLPAPEPMAALPAPVEPRRIGVEPGVAAGEGFITRPSERDPNPVSYGDALDLSRRLPGQEGPARRLALTVAEVAGEPMSWTRLRPAQQVEVMRRLAERAPAPKKPDEAFSVPFRDAAEAEPARAEPTAPTSPQAGGEVIQSNSVEIFPAPRAKPTPEVAPAPAAERPQSPSNAPSEIEALNPSNIGVDARRFQFKGGGDEHGVTERLQGIQTWDQRLAGLAMVWRDANGRDWIADGHQRLGLAKRLMAEGQRGIRINAHVLRADQGVTDADARYIAAAKNVSEGTGSAVDAAKMIREARDRGVDLPPLPPRSALARDGAALAKLAPKPFGMVVNEIVPPQYGAVVGRLVADPLAQAEGMRLLATVKPDNLRQAEMLVRDMLTSGTERGVQQGLFGAEDFASSVVLERAKVVDEALKLLARDRATFRLLVRDADRIEAEGANRLDAESNAKRLTTDEQAADALQSLATRHGPVSDALTELARRLKNGDVSRAEAAREFIGVVRQSVEGRLGEGDQSGVHRRGVEGAGEDAPPVEPPVEGQDALFSRRRDREPTIRNDERQAELPGAEASPKQAVAARQADERGLRGKVPQKGVEDFGLFNSGLKQRDLLSGRRDAERALDAGDVPPETTDARGRLFGLIRALSRHLGVPESVGVKLVDRITQGDADALYDRTAKAVEIGLDTDADVMPFRVIHEATHVLMDPDVSPLSEGQRNTLAAGARAWLDRPFTEASLRPGSSAPAGLKTNRDYLAWLNPGASDAVLVEEAVAHMAERHLAAGLTPRSGLERAWSRGADFLRGLGQALRGEGFTTPEAVLRGILQGKPDTRAELGRVAAPYMRTPGVVPGVGLREDEEPAAEAAPGKVADEPAKADAEPAKPATEPRPFEDEIPDVTPKKAGVAGRMAGLEAARGSVFSSRRDAQDAQRRDGLPGFYSAVERATERLPRRGPAAAMLATLRNTQGVKPEEMKWLGVDRWLAEQGTQPVTREQVAEYVRANNLGLREMVNASTAEEADALGEKLYQLEDDLTDALERAGHVDPRGVLLGLRDGMIQPSQVPEGAREIASEYQATQRAHKAANSVERAPRYADYQLPGGDNYREMLITLPERKLSSDAQQNYRSSHWQEPNVLAHVRFNDRVDDAGRRTLLVEEVQSDWHQDGRKKGYATTDEGGVPSGWSVRERPGQRAGTTSYWVFDDGNRPVSGPHPTEDVARASIRSAAQQNPSVAVPDAPFKTSWPSLVMKRMLRYAAEHGYDRIAWVPGEQQAERYSLAQRVDRLSYVPSTQELIATKRGEAVLHKHVPPEKLPEYVGKEVAERLLASPDKPAKDGSAATFKQIGGADLRVGGEGMRGFYDRQLPAEVNKLVKRFGASVQPGKVEANRGGWHITPPERTTHGKWMVKGDDYNSTGLRFDTEAEARAALAEKIGKDAVHSVPITPELRSAALNDGFPLFSLRRDLLDTRDRLTNATRDVLAKSFFPMAGGSREGRVAAAKFANALRAVNTRYYEFDRLLSREFTPRQREAMWNAMDEQSVFEQVLRRDLAAMPAAKRAAHERQARADFERDGGGVAPLPPEARNTVEQLNAVTQRVWRDMQERNLVRPDAEGLPWYAPRMIVGVSEKGAAQSFGGGESGERGLSAMNPLGQNLSTARPKFREHLTAEMTEAAARAKFGDEARIVRDVRTLVQALMRNERSVAGADLVAYLKRTGDELGQDLVQYGSFRDDNEREWFTLDHPAMRLWRPAIDRAEDGTPRGVKKDAEGHTIFEQVPIKIRADFKDPLRAVLTEPDSAVVRGLMKAKAGVMHAIMFSPTMHLMVEVSRAMPMMPGKVLTGRVFVQGNRARQDAAYMDDAIRHGLAPIARGWSVDPNTVADQSAASTIEPGKIAAAVRSVAALRDKLANAAADPFRRAGMENVGRSVRDIIAHPHQTMLWDRIYDLQVGIYDHAKGAFMREGMDAPAAKIMAAHIANRYAGALPAETMSKAANTAANLLLFSRSFTGGNLGVMKDTLSGAPQYVLDQIQAATGYGPHGYSQAQKARSLLRKKAIQGFLGDLAIMLVLNAGLQSGIHVLMADDKEAAADDEAQGYIRRLGKMVREKAEHPLSLLDPRWPLKALHDLTPNSENEPGKEDRIYLGQDDQGRGVYMRTPLGKVGEEFQGYLFRPIQMVVNKMSTFARPAAELVMGRDTLGREIFRPGAHTTEDQVENIGRAVRHILRSQLPADFLEGVYAKVTDTDTGDRGVNTAKVLGPITGLASISSGYPGGPAEGVRAEQRRQYSFDRAEAMKAARQLAQRGEIEKAREALSMAGLPPRDAAVALRSILYPAAGEARRRRDFERRATPEQRERTKTVTGGRPAYAVGGIAD